MTLRRARNLVTHSSAQGLPRQLRHLVPSVSRILLVVNPIGGRRVSTVPLDEVLRPSAKRRPVQLDEVLTAAKAAEGDAGKLPGTHSSNPTPATGHPGQTGVLWFANIYPTRAFWLDFRQVFTHHNHEELIPKLLPPGVEVVHMVPREREGGAFVYFRAKPSFVLEIVRKMSEQDAENGQNKRPFAQNEDILAKVSKGVSKYLKQNPVHAFLCPFPVRAHRVLGTPYIEDLATRYPGSRVKVHLHSANAEVTEEQLYAMLRHYGELNDISVLPEKKGFLALFRHTAAAVAARNCLHRSRIRPDGEAQEASVVLRLEYEAFMQKRLRELASNNLRVVLPLVVLVLLSTTYFIWDPLRTFSVQLRLVECLSEGDMQDGRKELPVFSGLWGVVVRFMAHWGRAQKQVWALIGGRNTSREGQLVGDFWADRGSEMDDLRSWMAGEQDQVLLLTGPRGNGQNTVMRHMLGRGAVFIDAGMILGSGGAVDDYVFVRALCKAVGYWPAQNMDRMLSALLDMILPGSGKLSRENEVLVAVQRVLSCVTNTLTEIERHRSLAKVTGPAPLFIICGFTSENKSRREGFFDTLVEWAAYVSETKLARVLFIADSSFAEPAMLAALKERPERLSVHELNDVNPKLVPGILRRHFAHTGLAELPEVVPDDISAIGGRFRDISTLVGHMKAGLDSHEAVRKQIFEAETTVRSLLMTGQPGVKWTRPQLWRAIRLLAIADSNEGVPYDVFLWSVFRGDEAALRSMKESALIHIVLQELQPDLNKSARRFRVCPGSPLFGEIYRRLVLHDGLAAVFDLEVAKEDVKREQTTLDSYEADLVRLQEVDDVRREKWRVLDDPNKALQKRKEQLLRLILEQHSKLEKYHENRRQAHAVLTSKDKKFRTIAPED